jgi:hypothetical protein
LHPFGEAALFGLPPHRDRALRYQLNAARHAVIVINEMTVENRMVLDVTAASRL